DRGGGVIADPAVHRRVLGELLDWLARWGERSASVQPLVPRGLMTSPIAGREGNRGYLLGVGAGPQLGLPPAERTSVAARHLPAAGGGGPARWGERRLGEATKARAVGALGEVGKSHR